MEIVSPGRYPLTLAKRPLGSCPDSATDMKPSTYEAGSAKTFIARSTERCISRINFFIIQFSITANFFFQICVIVNTE